jgi:hypothetical protein
MIQIEKKTIMKMIETVEIKIPKFQRGPFSLQTLMKKMSWTSD